MQMQIDLPKQQRTYVTAVDADTKRKKSGKKTISKTIYGATPEQVMALLRRAVEQGDSKPRRERRAVVA